MAFAGNDVGEEKQTGFTFREKPLLLSKTRGRPPTGKLAVGKNGWWAEKKRIEAITLFAATGNAKKVEELSGVPAPTVSKWVKEPWAKEILTEIHDENDAEIDAKFTKIVSTALDQVQDRLENGDYVLQRNGETVRKPVGARDLANVTTSILDKRQLLRGKPTSRTESANESSRLKRLEEAFTKLGASRRAPVEITDVSYEEVAPETEKSQSSGSDHGGMGDLTLIDPSPRPESV